MGVSGRLTVRHVQPEAASKPYLCPGCEAVIPKGRFHLVVVPEDEPDLRRHWHHGCWYKEGRRTGRPSGPAPRRDGAGCYR